MIKRLKDKEFWLRLLSMLLIFVMSYMGVKFANAGDSYQQAEAFRIFCICFSALALVNLPPKDTLTLASLLYIPICYVATHIGYERRLIPDTCDYQFVYIIRLGKGVILGWGLMFIGMLRHIIREDLPRRFFEALKERKLIARVLPLLWCVYAIVLSVVNPGYAYVIVFTLGFSAIFILCRDGNVRKRLFGAYLDGTLLCFLILTERALRHRPYDTERYLFYFSNENMAGMYLATVFCTLAARISAAWGLVDAASHSTESPDAEAVSDSANHIASDSLNSLEHADVDSDAASHSTESPDAEAVSDSAIDTASDSLNSLEHADVGPDAASDSGAASVLAERDRIRKASPRHSIFKIALLYILLIWCGVLVLFNYSRTYLLGMSFAFFVYFIISLLRSEKKSRILLRFALPLLLIILCMYPGYLVIRYTPALFDSPVYFYGEEGNMTRVQPGDPADSPRYTSLARYFTLSLGKWGIDLHIEDSEEQEQLAEEEGIVSINEDRDVSNGRTWVWSLFLPRLRMSGHYPGHVELEDGRVIFHAHNTYFQNAFQYGIPAGLIFALLIFCAFVYACLCGLKLKQPDAQLRFSLLALGTMMLGMLTEWSGHPVYPFGMFWMLAMSALLYEDMRSIESRKQKQEP